MRELKFRAWDKYDKIFREVVKINYRTEKVDVRHPEGNVTNVDDSMFAEGIKILQFDSLQQYTGLRDKNGKEIYEGDIVKLVNKDGIKHITEIKWHNGRYVIDTWMMFADTLVLHKCEVIGNIYENSELIQ